MKFDKSKCIFGDSPKTGCTSMKTILAAREKPFNPLVTRNPGSKALSKYIPDIYVDKDKEYEGYYKFVFVRNPFDRLVSAWKWGMHGFVDWRQESFGDFVTSLMEGGSRELKDTSDQKANHVVPWTWLFDKEYFDFVGRFENLPKDWEVVAKRLGIKSQLPVRNKTEHCHYSVYYNDDLIDWVSKFYKKEIELFDYEFEEEE